MHNTKQAPTKIPCRQLLVFEYKRVILHKFYYNVSDMQSYSALLKQFNTALQLLYFLSRELHVSSINYPVLLRRMMGKKKRRIKRKRNKKMLKTIAANKPLNQKTLQKRQNRKKIFSLHLVLFLFSFIQLQINY